ncbi:MAG: hypothetical protein JWN53_1138 [Gemmatimonadetes bacterium]|nr:hypothetical protein [Gemmatimonadota bacterium]
MTTSDQATARAALRFLAILFAAISAFFIFYTIRLLVVTRALQATRPGGQGAYVGAVVFPLLAIGCGWVSWRCFKRSHRIGLAPPPPHS